MKIGLEIHVQLRTSSKLFCSCSTDFLHAAPNTHVCPTCTGQPGSKPSHVNGEALRKALTVAVALGCKVSDRIVFMRKHYFYPDLPNNYQRTSTPLGVNGELAGVRIREVHLEEDPGRYDLKRGTVDYNRSGVPLIEIVTEPDMESPEDARRFLKELKAVLDYLDIQLYRETGFRVDVNVSLEGGSRVEVKNINSIDSVVRAIMYEVSRHRKLLADGKAVARETRHWDEDRGVTVALRAKETAEDYRYIPDPDLPAYPILPELVEDVKSSLPELPSEKMKRLVDTYGIDKSAAHTFVLDKELGDLFEHLAKKTDPSFALTFCSMLRGELNYRGIYLASVPSPERLEVLADLFYTGRVTKPVAVEQMRKILDDESFVPSAEERVTGEELRKIVEEVIRAEEKAVNEYKGGEKKALHFLVGRVLARTKGKADPKEVTELLRNLLG